MVQQHEVTVGADNKVTISNADVSNAAKHPDQLANQLSQEVGSVAASDITVGPNGEVIIDNEDLKKHLENQTSGGAKPTGGVNVVLCNPTCGGVI